MQTCVCIQGCVCHQTSVYHQRWVCHQRCALYTNDDTHLYTNKCLYIRCALYTNVCIFDDTHFYTNMCVPSEMIQRCVWERSLSWWYTHLWWHMVPYTHSSLITQSWLATWTWYTLLWWHMVPHTQHLPITHHTHSAPPTLLSVRSVYTKHILICTPHILLYTYPCVLDIYSIYRVRWVLPRWELSINSPMYSHDWVADALYCSGEWRLSDEWWA